MTARRRSDESGFTLIEVIIASAILLLATTTIYRVFNSSSKSVAMLQNMVVEQAKARTALATVQSDLRNAFSGSDTVAQISTLGPTTMTFTAADRTTPIHLRRITYTLASGVLSRSSLTSTNTYTTSPMAWTWPGTTPTAVPLVSGVSNTTVFVFKDASGAVTATPANVTLVEITLTVKSTTATASQNPETYTTSIRMRGKG